MLINTIRQLNNFPKFSAQKEDDKNHVSTGQIATATGATAAGANSTYKIVKSYTSKTANALKQTNKTVKEVNTVFSGLKINSVKIKNQILRWGEGFRNSRLLKPLLTNKLFKIAAAGIGNLMAICIFISGLGQIFNAAVLGMQKLFDN